MGWKEQILKKGIKAAQKTDKTADTYTSNLKKTAIAGKNAAAWTGKKIGKGTIAAGTAGFGMGAAALGKGTEKIKKVFPQHEFDWLVIGGAVLHLINWLFFNFEYNPLYQLFNLVFMLYVGFAVFKWQRNPKYIFPVLLTFFLEAGLIGVLGSQFPFLVENSITQYFFMRVLWPYWLLLGLIYGEKEVSEPSHITNMGLAAFIIFWLITGGMIGILGDLPEHFDVFQEQKFVAQEEAEKGVISQFKETWHLFADRIACASQMGTGNYENCMEKRLYGRHPELAKEAAAGVIDNSMEFVDVNIQPAGTTDFAPPKDISVRAYMKISNPELGFDIKSISCHFEKGARGSETVVQGTVSPSSVTANNYITCSPKKALSKGTWRAVFEADIDRLESSSEIKLYFVSIPEEEYFNIINPEVKDISYRSKIENLKDYEGGKWRDLVDGVLIEGKVQSTSSPGFMTTKIGPPLVGGKIVTLPIYNIHEEDRFYLVVNVENLRDGSINDIYNLEFHFPDGMSYQCSDTSNDYLSDLVESQISELKKIKDVLPEIAECTLTVNNINTFLLNVNVPELKRFRVDLNYEYKVKEEIDINIREGYSDEA
ncbi:hypothetical protein GF336_06715 [Candidatus Woesearchaeota archaeon]|nr:hypothetical protein [Candidatus Woesearchaeota archaeon]